MRVRGTIAYDGSPFYGFAYNAGVRTVAGDLSAALSEIFGGEFFISCAGRTDRGVHSVGQVVSFDIPEGADLYKLARSLNSLCAPHVAIYELSHAEDDFDARFSATGRQYRYRLLNREEPDPFLARTAWHVREELNFSAMAAAAEYLVGEHDFSSFCRRPRRTDGATVSLVRTVEEVGWWLSGNQLPGVLDFKISAVAFCHQMVRSIVGTLVKVGSGHRSPSEVHDILISRDRQMGDKPAPPHGLVLWSVRYGDKWSDPPGEAAGLVFGQ